MRALPTLVLLAICLLGPLTVACYPPRTDVCREGASSPEGISDVELFDIDNTPGFEVSSPINFRLRARSTRAISCVSIHSEVWLGGARLDTVDTPVTATTNGAIVETTPIYHYDAPVGRGGMELRVTAFGTTLTAPIPSPPLRTDAGPGDAGPRDAGGDARTPDVGAVDGGEPDVGEPDAGERDAG